MRNLSIDWMKPMRVLQLERSHPSLLDIESDDNNVSTLSIGEIYGAIDVGEILVCDSGVAKYVT